MAIDDLLDEHEQSERVLTWLRRNGSGLIGGVVLGLAIIGGWQWWQRQRDARDMAASDQYQAAQKSLDAKNTKQAQTQAAGLKDTPYAALLALDLSKSQMDAGQRDAAIATLRGTHSDDTNVQRVINQRLARLLTDAGKSQDALKVLGDADDAASLEARGDAFFALGKVADSRKAYEAALPKLDVTAPQRQLLELKLIDVGGTPNKPEARS